MTELEQLTIAEASSLIRQKKLSPVELVDVLLARTSRYDSQLRSFITVTADFARDAAKDAEREIARDHYRGALHGIPFGLKDLIDTAGIPTTGNSRVYQTRVPDADATVTAKLKAAGAVWVTISVSVDELIVCRFDASGVAAKVTTSPAEMVTAVASVS